jgi:multidrug resistance efflux pump
MYRNWILAVLAFAGVSFAVYTVARGSKPVPAAAPVAQPPQTQLASRVAGAGIVEASTENIAIGTPVGNVVTHVHVRVGDRVKQGDALFQLREQITRAELQARQAGLAAAEARLARLRQLPRTEEVPPAEARLREAEALVADLGSQLALWESVTDKRAVSQEELIRKRNAVIVAEARAAAAKADLELLRAGAWEADLKIATAEVEEARALVAQAEAELDRRTIRAPISGQVLQVKIRPGEYAQASPLETPLMILGSTEDLHLRVDIDENDSWRVKPGARAEASLRGNSALRVQLEPVRVEPYVVPKRSLTGDSTERVDTRVLQLIYRIVSPQFPVYAGQQMDVFIEATPTAAAEDPMSGAER